MRVTPLLLLPLALPLSAQQFEGRVTMTIPEAAQDITWTVKGPRSLISMPSPAGQGGDAKVILDTQARNATVLVAVPGRGGVRMTLPMDAASSTSSTTPDASRPAPPRKLGTSQTIAGHKCDDYELADAEKTRLCLATTLGSFLLPTAAGGPGMAALAGGRPGAMSALSTAQSWSKSLPPNAFPLKVWNSSKVVLEVTKVVKETVPADAFAIPADYTDMSGMMQQMQQMQRGRGGGH